MRNRYTVAEVGQYLKVGKSTPYDLARKGKAPAHKTAPKWRFDSDELDESLKSGKLGLPQEVVSYRQRLEPLAN